MQNDLSKEQQVIVDSVLTRAKLVSKRIHDNENDPSVRDECHGIVITGCAGTGKTHVLHTLLHMLDCEHIKYLVVSYIGQAAVNSNGRTIHSAYGLSIHTPRNGTSVEAFVAQSTPLKSELFTPSLSVIFVEEFSTSNNFLISMMDHKLRKFYSSNRPFAGRLIVFFGDLLQLQSPCDEQFYFKSGEALVKMGPGYMSPSWDALNCKWFELEHQYRQESDVAFAKCLNGVRCANVTKEMCNMLLSRVLLVDILEYAWPNNILPTFLFCTNRQVDAMNAAQFKKLVEREQNTTVHTIRGVCRRANGTRCDANDFSVAQLVKQSNVPAEYQLCVGCQVMVRTNIDVLGGICNGTRAIVEDFVLSKNTVLAVIVRLNTGRLVTIYPYVFRKYTSGQTFDGGAEYSQIPLVLAWAMTIHKSQGLTISPLAVDIGPTCFEECQVYVALSRTTRLDSLYLTNVDFDAIRVRSEICEKYVECLPNSDSSKQLRIHLKNTEDTKTDDAAADDDDDNRPCKKVKLETAVVVDHRYDYDDLFDLQKYPNAGDVSYFRRNKMTNISPSTSFGVEMVFTPRLGPTDCEGLARFFVGSASNIVGVVHRSWAQKYLGERQSSESFSIVDNENDLSTIRFHPPMSFITTLIFDFWPIDDDGTMKPPSTLSSSSSSSSASSSTRQVVLQEKSETRKNINNINFFISSDYLFLTSGLTLINKQIKISRHGCEIFLLKNTI